MSVCYFLRQEPLLALELAAETQLGGWPGSSRRPQVPTSSGLELQAYATAPNFSVGAGIQTQVLTLVASTLPAEHLLSLPACLSFFAFFSVFAFVCSFVCFRQTLVL